jgi:hypothetical protein
MINTSHQEQSIDETISEYELSEIDKADSQNYDIHKDLSTPVTPHQGIFENYQANMQSKKPI